MAYLNENYLKLQAGYLFPEIARRVRAFTEAEPSRAQSLIRCGIGDVTEPLPAAVRRAMHDAIDELGARGTFRGYGPEGGYEFLRAAIAEQAYGRRGLAIAPDEVFVSDGSKCDGGNILDVLGDRNRFAVMDPVYPVYVDTNVMAGHTGPGRGDGSYEGLTYLRCHEANGFVPAVPDAPVDVVYLCYPNNPTGAVATREQLLAWVTFAQRHGTLILFDAAYEAFVTDPEIPRSIYEIPGATECAVEFRSFSKTAGFTGVRCAWTVVPKALCGQTAGGKRVSLHGLWARRFSTKFNGVSYPVQRGAAAVYTDEGRAEVAGLIAHYLENAGILAEGLRAGGLRVFGGTNAPYLWVRTPGDRDSWAVFDELLRQVGVVVTPGVGFGAEGEGFLRVSAFNSRENAREAAARFANHHWT